MTSDETREFDKGDSTKQLPRTAAVRHTRRLVIAVVGGLFILGAALIIPIPGPWSFFLVFVGLTILSWEFLWARRLLARVKLKMNQIRARIRRD